jgi:hypothetical protein
LLAGGQQATTGQNQPVKVLAAAFDRNGRSVASEEQTVAVASRAPVERLASGEYVLTIEAAQSERVARRGLRFTMRQP